MPDARDELITISVGGQTSVDLSLGFFSHTVYVENFTNQYVSFPDVSTFIPPYTARLLALPGVQKAKFLFGAPPGTTQVASITGQICNATWSERSTPVTGGPIGPIGVTSNYYDRNPLSKTFSFTTGAAGLAPHALTTRWGYAVPANRKAFLEALDVISQAITALTGGPGLVETQIVVTPIGFATVEIVDALITDPTGKPNGTRADRAIGGSIELQPGDTIAALTGNTFGAGTVFHQASAKLTEFDA